MDRNPKVDSADWYLEKGKLRTKVCLAAWNIGRDLMVCLHNQNIHLGAVTVSQFDHETNRVSISTITLLGHKDDAVAQKAAYAICRHTRRPVCAIAGIHVDNVTEREIAEILDNANQVIEELIILLP